ncbi:MAG: AAA family ATPase, partial [Bacteroidota bacterium]
MFTGPESSGKSTMTNRASEQLAAPFLEEYARTFLAKLGRPYVVQ